MRGREERRLPHLSSESCPSLYGGGGSTTASTRRSGGGSRMGAHTHASTLGESMQSGGGTSSSKQASSVYSSFDMRTRIPSEFHEYSSDAFPMEIMGARDEDVAMAGARGVRTFPSQRPTSRKEAQLLSRVYNAMMTKVQDINDEEGMEERQLQVCDVVMHELARQVYVGCEDRGVLLRKVISKWQSVWKKQCQRKEDEVFERDDRIAELERELAQVKAERQYDQRKLHEDMKKIDQSRFAVDETAYTTFLANLQKYHVHLDLLSEKTKAWSRIRQRFVNEQKRWQDKYEDAVEREKATKIELEDAEELIAKLEESNGKLASELTELRNEFLMLRRAAMRIAAAGADADIDSDLRHLRKTLKQLRQNANSMYMNNTSEVNLEEQYEGKLEEELQAQQGGLIEASAEILPSSDPIIDESLARHPAHTLRKEKPLKSVHGEDEGGDGGGGGGRRGSPIGKRVAELIGGGNKALSASHTSLSAAGASPRSGGGEGGKGRISANFKSFAHF